MSGQAQCPNCGGYKATSQKYAIKRVTPVPMRNRLIMAGILLGLAILAVGVSALSGGDGWVLLCGGLLGISWFFGAIRALFQSKATKVIGTAYQFDCKICGYRWDWQEGQPWPRVKVDPELLEKGAQRLAEEEAELRRQQEAALYYLSQQNRK